jgi:outer membrane lipoprotein LolB
MKNNKLLCNVALATACAFLSACATTPSAPPSEASVAAYRDVIDMAGRLSVNYDKDGKQETLSGKFTWTQRATAVDVALISPLGQTIATIAVTPASATLTQSGKAPRTAADIDSLTAQTLGWSLPVSGLRDWLQGYAVAADGQRFAASPARNTVTTRDGWRLTFVNWQDGVAGQPVPKRIDAQRVAAAGVSELSLRIVIDQPG